MGIYLIRISRCYCGRCQKIVLPKGPEEETKLVSSNPSRRFTQFGMKTRYYGRCRQIVLHKGRDRVMILEPHRRHLDPSGSIGAQ
jgi:hypothetical protein